jgi:hypothetical protein
MNWRMVMLNEYTYSVETITDALAKSGLIGDLLLLLLGALLTGILVPYVKAKMDKNAFESQKIFEADVARQSDVIKAQIQFLNIFSEYIWEYHRISQRVSFTRLSGDKIAYQEAVQDYNAKVWDSLQKTRAAIGRARWFCSDAAHQALRGWYEEWFVTLEMRLRELINENPKDQKWSEHHAGVHYEASERNYGLLLFLANDFGLRSIVEGHTAAKMSRPKKYWQESSQETTE